MNKKMKQTALVMKTLGLGQQPPTTTKETTMLNKNEALQEANAHLGYRVEELESEVERGAMKLIQHADVLIGKLEMVKGRMRALLDESKKDILVLRKRTGLNSLGELQGNGVEFDRMCSEFTLKQEELQKCGRLLGMFQQAL